MDGLFMIMYGLCLAICLVAQITLICSIDTNKSLLSLQWYLLFNWIRSNSFFFQVFSRCYLNTWRRGIEKRRILASFYYSVEKGNPERILLQTSSRWPFVSQGNCCVQDDLFSGTAGVRVCHPEVIWASEGVLRQGAWSWLSEDAISIRLQRKVCICIYTEKSYLSLIQSYFVGTD